jgi:hypothetical protein
MKYSGSSLGMRARQRRKTKQKAYIKTIIQASVTSAKSSKPAINVTIQEGRRFKKAELLVKTQL